MSATGYKDKKGSADNQPKVPNEELFLTRSYFSESSDEDQICGRAIETLDFLCPEVSWNADGTMIIQPEGSN